MDSAEAQFDLYGLRLAVTGWRQVVAAIELDFEWIRRTSIGRPAISIRVRERKPSFDGPPLIRASYATSRNVVYQAAVQTIVNYFNRALVIFDRVKGEISVSGDQEQLRPGAACSRGYLPPRVGDHLDRHSLMRLHALALSGRQGGVELLLPSGGGKTTLALRAHDEGGVRLFSDDTPLLDRGGHLHAFPLRLGVSEEVARALPTGAVRRIERFDPAKHVLPLNRFAHRRDKVAASRAAICRAALVQARTWELELGRDGERHWYALQPLLARR